MGKNFIKCFLFFDIAVFTVIMSGCGIMPKSSAADVPILQHPPKTQYETQDIKRGSIQNSIIASGTVICSTKYNLDFGQSTGKLKYIKVKEGDKVTKGQVLAQLDEGDIENDVAKDKLLLQKAQIEVQKLQSSNGNQYDIEEAEINEKLQETELNSAQNKYSNSTITAPISGIVLSLGGVKIGDEVQPYESIITLGDPSQAQVQYQGEKASKFKTGMNVDITCSGQKYQGQVVTTPENATSTSKDASSTVLIKFITQPKTFSFGQSVDLNVIIQQKDNIIAVPSNLVKKYGGKSYISVLNNGTKVDKLVETGLESDTEIEITKGLSDSDKIISGD